MGGGEGPAGIGWLEFVDPAVVDGDGAEVGGGEAGDEAGEEDADDDAVGDEGDGLAGVGTCEGLEGGEEAGAHGTIGFAPFVGGVEVAGHPAVAGVFVVVPEFKAGDAAQGAHFAFMKVGDDLDIEAGGGGNGAGGFAGAAQCGAVEGGGGEVAQGFAGLLGLAQTLGAEADVGLGAMEEVGGGGLGMAEDEDAGEWVGGLARWMGWVGHAGCGTVGSGGRNLRRGRTRAMMANCARRLERPTRRRPGGMLRQARSKCTP